MFDSCLARERKEMKKIALTAFLLLFLVFPLAAAEEKRFDVAPGDSPYLGSPDAAITIIEFLDFQ